MPVALAPLLATLAAPAWAGPDASIRDIPAGGAWAAEVRQVLVSQYDRSGDGALDLPEEVAAVPCAVWRAVDAAVARDWDGLSVRKVYGFDPGFRYMGQALGLPVDVRDAAVTAMVGCSVGGPAPTTAPPVQAGAGGGVDAPQGPAGSLGALPTGDPSSWDAAARALLVAHFDANDNGEVDADELDAVGCDVWTAVDAGARANWPGGSLRAVYGVDPAFTWVGGALGLAAEARVALRVRLSACGIRADAPSPLPATVPAGEVLDALAALPSPGSDTWDREVRALLHAAYDADHTLRLDTADEVARVPCEVWRALDAGVREGWTMGLRRIYGFAPDYLWVGDAVGFAESQRATADAAAEACGLQVDPDNLASLGTLQAGEVDRARTTLTRLPTADIRPGVPVVLSRVFDGDGDGVLGTPEEIASVPCDLLLLLDGLLVDAGEPGLRDMLRGSAAAGTLVDDLGVDPRQRRAFDKRLRTCGVP